MNIVSLSEDEQGQKDEQAKEKNGGCELTASPRIVLVHIKLQLSHIALSPCKHTLVFQCMLCVQNDTFFGIGHNENISTV